MSRPQIAIVTITLNDPVGVRRTIDSVRRQGAVSYEHVVVDGGSGTEVVDWLEGWRGEAPEHRLLVTDAPPGIYPAMNAGIRSTSAPLILMLNGGDRLQDGVLPSVLEHHGAQGWRWAYGRLEVRDSDDRVVGAHTFHPFSLTVFRAGIDWVPHPSAYITRELLDEIGLYREDLGTEADQELLLRAAAVAEPGYIPRTLSAFERGGVSYRTNLLRRELVWHRLRLASRTAFGGRRSTDALVTMLLIAWRIARMLEHRLRGVIPWASGNGTLTRW